MESKSGTLYVVATPIGNLADLTLRALEQLKSVNRLYAEDTRVSKRLLSRYNISKPLASYREAAPPAQVERTIQGIIRQLEEGEDIAYLSDAGTPGISDPGSYLVRRVREAGIRVVPLPGASALTTLLCAAGLPAERPLFVGFLPKKKGHQTLMGKLRQALVDETADTVVCYESPQRIIKLLRELETWRLPLFICLGRELTKVYEEILTGSLADILAELEKRPSIKGEIVLAIALAKT